MFRAAIEFLFTILIILVARAILTSVLGGIAKAARNSTDSPREAKQRPPEAKPSGELHKDPICGTYVAESTPYRRQAGGQSFYYCSDVCREKHTLVAR
jgi:YHS domain-containing protein